MNPKAYFDNNSLMVQEGYVYVLFSVKEGNIVKSHIQQASKELDLEYHRIYLPDHSDFEDIFRRIQIAEVLIVDVTNCSPEMICLSGIALARKDKGRIIIIRDKQTTTLPALLCQHEYHYTYNSTEPENLKELQQTLLETMRAIQEQGRAEKRQWPFSDITLPEVLFRNAISIDLMKSAMQAIKQEKWVTADVLLNKVNAEEPNNWYILLQWGVMLRNKGEFQNALKKFNKALKHVKFNQERAYVCVEKALLYHHEALLCLRNEKNKESERLFNKAENWFDQAEKADNMNLYVYRKLAEYNTNRGHFQNASTKITGLLKRLGQNHPNYDEFQTWEEYFQRRIDLPGYQKTFEVFRKEREESLVKFQDKVTIEQKGWKEYELSHDITWEGIITRVGKLAAGMVNNIDPRFGVFVKLSRDFTGLIYPEDLPSDFPNKFSKNQPLLVRIKEAKINTKKNNRKDISLSLRME